MPRVVVHYRNTLTGQLVARDPLGDDETIHPGPVIYQQGQQVPLNLQWLIPSSLDDLNEKFGPVHAVVTNNLENDSLEPL